MRGLRVLRWAAVASAFGAGGVFAGQSATLAIKVVVPPQASAIPAAGSAAAAPDLSVPAAAAPLTDIAGLSAGRFSATIVSTSAAAFGAPRFTAPGSAGVSYSLSLDGRPIRFEGGRAELAASGNGRLAITTSSAVPPPLTDSLLLVLQAN